MKWIKKLKDRITGLTDAIARFPLTTVYLLAAVIINAYDINTEQSISKLLLTFLVGAFLSAVSQVAYERFFTKISSRFVLMGLVVLLTACYGLIIRPAPKLSMEIGVRTAVALFALFIAFILVPVIKSKVNFNKSFMIAFKSLFNTLFFSGVIFAGISIILTAINLLIFAVNYRAYPHMANLIFVLFAPMYFLSLIPKYPGAKTLENPQQIETVNTISKCPKFLQILISYIIIPLVAVFTLILVIYIIKNISGTFWTDNLLEPMLVSYAITVILVYILASEIENKFTVLFRKIFPKVLVPIVLFQITASILSSADTGITHTRYYVILFGIYAAASGVLLSILPIRKNGVIAALLIVFATISIVPPVDAFTISRNSQTQTLKNVLVKNHMLKDKIIKPNGSISDKDKKTITNAVYYLNRMEYTKKIKWLPKRFNADADFYQTFGFKEYQDQRMIDQSVYLNLEPSFSVSISGYDSFVQAGINSYGKPGNGTNSVIDKRGQKYTLNQDTSNGQIELNLMGANDRKLISFNTQEIFDRFSNYQSTKGQMSVKEATFTKENDQAKITIVVQSLGIDKQSKQNNNASVFVFVQIK
ncbi:DUF4153 domain-containing protein [Neobacillus sp. PS3-12]|uniref:DUF4153 domain-containing protein n=1 Tax=Neobacillus sp. PS3-12 TaxID=3070677 RepID=UPI0027E1414C|nr:DUF4153 domain-containing protein [Neobacillus sp. PS3-12]WML55370.1 DUF4153 domain-containing protein [Neobacillus sp. PS3-12]